MWHRSAIDHNEQDGLTNERDILSNGVLPAGWNDERAFGLEG